MKWLFTILTFFIALSLAADTTSTSSTSTTSTKSASTTSKTVVWATGTNASGVLATTSSYYTQTFSIYYSSTTGGVSSGSIGLGTISGSVGRIRQYSSSTISNSASAVKIRSSGYFKQLNLGTTALIAGLPLFVISVFFL